MPNHPRFKTCDYCGRNPHKVAVRLPSGKVAGYCPSCVRQTPNLIGEGKTIIYDRRKRK